MKNLFRRFRFKARVRKDYCIACGSSSAPWVWAWEAGGEVRLCDWHNSEMQMNTRKHPLRHEAVS